MSRKVTDIKPLHHPGDRIEIEVTLRGGGGGGFDMPVPTLFKGDAQAMLDFLNAVTVDMDEGEVMTLATALGLEQQAPIDDIQDEGRKQRHKDAQTLRHLGRMLSNIRGVPADVQTRLAEVAERLESQPADDVIELPPGETT